MVRMSMMRSIRSACSAGLVVLATLLLLATTAGAQTPGSGVEYLHVDALGSVRVVTDATGAVISRHDYLPYGEEVPEASRAGLAGYNAELLPAATQRFTGKERDVETGLDYFGARYYSGSMGRFTGVDLPFADQHIEKPQSWNLYSYAWSNPQAYVDDDGRGVKSKVLKALLKGGDIASTLADLAEDGAVIGSMDPAIGTAARGVATAKLVWEISPASDVADAGRLAGKALGRAGKSLEGAAEALLSLTHNVSQRIPSSKGAFRIPDFMGYVKGLGAIIGEAKDVGKLHFSSQLRDTLDYAKRTGTQAILLVSERTSLTKPLAENWVAAGAKIYRKVGDEWIDITVAVKKQFDKAVK